MTTVTLRIPDQGKRYYLYFHCKNGYFRRGREVCCVFCHYAFIHYTHFCSEDLEDREPEPDPEMDERDREQNGNLGQEGAEERS